MSDVLTRLFEHLKWADERVHESLENAANPPAHTLDLFAHVVATEHVWLSRIRGETPEVAGWPKLSLAQCAELGTRNAEEALALIESMDEMALEGGVTYRNSAGAEFTNSVSDILIHIALHGTYHRGQIATAVRVGGDTPATTDYITLARGVIRASSPGTSRTPTVRTPA
jgi:uncharacterized damage-inducible protein DinB